MIISLFTSASASDLTLSDPASDMNHTRDIYEENLSEILSINNADYLYSYSYQNGNRTTSITNLETGVTDVLIFDSATLTTYLNGEVIATISKVCSSVSGNGDVSICAAYQVIATETHRITWAEGTTAAVVAGMIAAYIGIKSSNVLLVIGSTALAAVVGSCTGATLYTELLLYTAPLATPQNVVKWTFTADTGDKYGPFFSYL